MKRIFLAIAALILLSSCSYLSPFNLSNTSLKMEVLDLKATYALIKITPSNDYTLYMADVMKAEDFEKLLDSLSEAEFQELCIKKINERYNQWRELWPGNTDKYVANLCDHEYYVSPLQGYFLNLKPSTKYYVYGFCFNPNTSKAMGPVQKLAFTTTENRPSPIGVDFDFMIHDTKDDFFYYVRPSQGGRIWYDGYFSAIFKDSEYIKTPYDGDIRAYLKNWLKDSKDYIEGFLNIDISRCQSNLILEEGEYYTILACPYINIGDGPLTLLHFQYKKGMNTKYRHDEIID